MVFLILQMTLFSPLDSNLFPGGQGDDGLDLDNDGIPDGARFSYIQYFCRSRSDLLLFLCPNGHSG